MPKMNKTYFIVVNNKKVAVSYQIYQEYMHSVYKEENLDRKFKATESLDFDIYGDELSGTAIKLAIHKYEDEQYSEQLKSNIEQRCAILKPKEQELITALFFNGKSQAQYAKESGLTPSAVSKKLDRILKKLRKYQKNE